MKHQRTSIGLDVHGRSVVARALDDPSVLFDGMFAFAQHSVDRIYALGEPPDYEPTGERTVAAIARQRGEDPLATMYDLMLGADAGTVLMLPMYNYAEGNHDAIGEMLIHPAGVLGLSDGGAHCPRNP